MTSRLVRLAKTNWPSLDGMMASTGIDPLDLPIDRWLNWVYWWAIKDGAEQSEIDKFNRHLWMPPKGEAAPAGSPWSAEAETAAFGAFAAEFEAMAGGR